MCLKKEKIFRHLNFQKQAFLIIARGRIFYSLTLHGYIEIDVDTVEFFNIFSAFNVTGQFSLCYISHWISGSLYNHFQKYSTILKFLKVSTRKPIL